MCGGVLVSSENVRKLGTDRRKEATGVRSLGLYIILAYFLSPLCFLAARNEEGPLPHTTYLLLVGICSSIEGHTIRSFCHGDTKVNNTIEVLCASVVL